MPSPTPTIETTRLVIQPLTYEQLVQYARCDGTLEAALAVAPSARTISAELREALEQTFLPNLANPANNPLYHTLWTAILKEGRHMIGDLCIVGPPNAEGEIEIGYGTYDAFQGRGLMTEMVGGMIGWAMAQPGISAIVATTDPANIASFRVLQKNGFTQVGEKDGMLLWKLQ